MPIMRRIKRVNRVAFYILFSVILGGVNGW